MFPSLNRFRIPFRLGLKRRFLVFFVLGSILPLLAFGGVFLHKTKALLQARNRELLQTGMLFSRESVLDELDKLELAASELASLSVNEKYERALQQRDFKPLGQLLQAYIGQKDVDLLVLASNQGQPVAIAAPPSGKEALTERALIGAVRSFRQLAGKGNLVTGIAAVPIITGQPPALMMLAATPVFSVSHGNRLNGVLILGKDLRHLVRQGAFSRLPQDLTVRILPRAAVTTLSLPAPTLAQLAAAGKNFEETLGGVAYNSLASPIRNLDGQIVGYLLISTPQQSLNALINQNTLYIVLYLLAAIVLVTALGAWFNRTFITPMNALSDVTELVSAGNLNARVTDQVHYPAMDRTLRNFNRMLDQLKEQQGLHQAFISTLTHDLRTPLIAQQRVIDFLKPEARERLTPQAIKLLEGLDANNAQLLRMIQQLLEAFQYETGKITLHPQRTDLRTLVADCLDQLSPLADAQRIAMHNAVPEPLWVMIDPHQFRRVLNNLIGNSLDNIGEGDAITVSAGLAEEGRFWLRVADTGPGVEPEWLPHLFERYPTAVGRQQKIGSGLGLYICKMIIELHGGTVTVESAPGQGAAFTLHCAVGPGATPALHNHEELFS